MSVSVPNELTVVSEDGQWKAEMKAWKDYWFFYASIGSQVDVYHREKTKDTWGNTKTDWVKRPAAIFINNTYQGSLAGSPAPGTGGEGGPPPSGGLGGTYVRDIEVQGAHAENRLWATGFFSTKISVSGEQTRPAGATLDISNVVAEISVGVGTAILRGTVAASSYVSDNSAWG